MRVSPSHRPVLLLYCACSVRCRVYRGYWLWWGRADANGEVAMPTQEN
jgi:hypothetical protein